MNEPDESAKKHNWEHRGIAPFVANGTKFESWGKIFLSLLFGILSGAFFFGGRVRDINDLITWKGEVDNTLRRMDEKGTNRSQWVDDAQEASIHLTAARVAELEHKFEQIGVIKSKLEQLNDDIKRVEAKPPK